MSEENDTIQEKQQSPVEQMIALMKQMSSEDKAAIAQALTISTSKDTPPEPQQKPEFTDRHKGVIVPIETSNKTPHHSEMSSRKSCTTSKIPLGPRENKFLTMIDKRGRKIAESCKADSKIDKILLKNVSPVPRTRDNSIVNVQCCVCGNAFSTDSNNILEGNRVKCDNCIRG